MKKKLFFILVMVFCVFFMGFLNHSVFSQKNSPNVQEKIIYRGEDTEIKGAINNVSVAHSLIKYGRETCSPVALIMAAEILSAIDFHDQEGKPAIEILDDIDITDENRNPPEPLKNDPESLILEAKIMAEKNAYIMDVIKNFSGQMNMAVIKNTRGEVEIESIYRFKDNWIMGNEKHIWTFDFAGGEIAEVLVVPNKDAELDIYVYDEFDNFITKDEENQDTGYVSWYPARNGTFKVVVVTYNKAEDWYDLYVN